MGIWRVTLWGNSGCQHRTQAYELSHPRERKWGYLYTNSQQTFVQAAKVESINSTALPPASIQAGSPPRSRERPWAPELAAGSQATVTEVLGLRECGQGIRVFDTSPKLVSAS